MKSNDDKIKHDDNNNQDILAHMLESADLEVAKLPEDHLKQAFVKELIRRREQAERHPTEENVESIRHLRENAKSWQGI